MSQLSFNMFLCQPQLLRVRVALHPSNQACRSSRLTAPRRLVSTSRPFVPAAPARYFCVSSQPSTAPSPGVTAAGPTGRPTKPVILYDGVCGVCNAGVDFVLRFDSSDTFRLAALQSPTGRRLLSENGRDPEDISSIVLVDGNQAYTKSQACLKIGYGLAYPIPLLSAMASLIPTPVLDAAYDVLATNRYNVLGKRNECRLTDADPANAEKFIS